MWVGLVPNKNLNFSDGETSQADEEEEHEDEERRNDADAERLIQNISENIEVENQIEEHPTASVSNAHNAAYISKDSTKWEKEPVRQRTRTTQENIIREKSGVKREYQEVKTHQDCFDLFFNENIMITVCLFTNEKIRYTNMLSSRKNQNDPTFEETTITELKALFGLLFLAGLSHAGRRNTNDLWNKDGTGVEIFPMTMSRNRFVFLINNLRFDSLLSRNDRSARDRLAPIREIFEYFVQNCQNIYNSTENLTLDEELIAFRGRCGFRQYIPSKPAKYGIKMYALVDSKTFYTLNLEIYCGKQPENSPYEVSNKPFDVVKRLTSPVSGSSKNITMDNFFTSLEAARYLLDNDKLTLVGTLRANKTCIPQIFKERREEHTSLFGFQKDVTLVSYAPKPRKMVYLLSTLHHEADIDSDTEEQQKPEIITYYNKTKSGVDVVDKLSRTYDVSRNSKRWPLTIFFSLLNHAGINAMIVYILNNRTQTATNTRNHFIRELGLRLIDDHLKLRKSNVRLTKELREKLHRHLNEPATIQTPVVEQGKKVRCQICPRNKDKKTKNRCTKCSIAICMEHCNFICPQCLLPREEDEEC